MVTDFAEIGARLEAQAAEATKLLARETISVGDGIVAFDGIGSYINKAVGFGTGSVLSPEQVALFEDFHASRGAEPRIEISPFVAQETLRALADSGFVLQEFENKLFANTEEVLAHAEELRAGWPRDMRIERVDVTNPEMLDTYVRTVSAGFTPPGQEVAEAMLAIARKAALTPGFTSFLVWVGDEPAGGASLQCDGGIAVLGGAAVLESFRRRGLQQALLAARARFAADHQCPLISVTSHPGIPTERNASRLGFRLAYTRSVLVKRRAGLVPSP